MPPELDNDLNESSDLAIDDSPSEDYIDEFADAPSDSRLPHKTRRSRKRTPRTKARSAQIIRPPLEVDLHLKIEPAIRPHAINFSTRLHLVDTICFAGLESG